VNPGDGAEPGRAPAMPRRCPGSLHDLDRRGGATHRSPLPRGGFLIQAMSQPSRRQLFLGFGLAIGAGLGGVTRWSRRSSPSGGASGLLRPPGALPEADFLAACTRCGQCVQECPYDTLKLADLACGAAAGTPYLDAIEVPCYLCAGEDELLCIVTCPTSALQPVEDFREIRMGTAVIDEGVCYAYNGAICRSCWHACPFPDEAIVFDKMLRPVVVEETCIGCGLCTYACPTVPNAIPIRPAGVEVPS
jgi:ferredoxin-type protein NapG